MPDKAIPPFNIRGHRFEHSPFYACYATAGALLGVYAGRLYPWLLDDDPNAAYWTLRRNAVLYDVPERPIEIAGPDAERLLDKVLTRDMSKLRVDRAAYGLACQPDGGILMDGIVMRLGPERFWYVQADGAIFPWFAAHGIDLAADVRDPRSWVLQVQGPRALDVLAAARDGGAPMRYFDVAECVMGGQPLTVSRTGWTGELGFEVYTRADTDGPALWRHLLGAGAPFGLIHASLASMGIRRIEAGILDNGTDMDSRMTPFAAGIGKFVDFAKPAFIGKAALETADRRPLLQGIEFAEAAPEAGAEVFLGNAAIGRVTTYAWSPYLSRGIGYVRLNAPGEWPGTEARVRTDDGSTRDARIVPLPFYDPEKKIARGLDTAIP